MTLQNHSKQIQSSQLVLLEQENERLKKELERYKTISRAVYELVNVSSLETWIESFTYEEGVDAVNHLKTLVESTQDVCNNWSYFGWADYVKTEMPIIIEETKD